MSAIEKKLREDIALLKSSQEEERSSRRHEKITGVVLETLERVSKTLLDHCSEIDDKGLLLDAQKVVVFFSKKVPSAHVYGSTNNDLSTRALSSVKSLIVQRRIALADTCFELRTGSELVTQDFSSVLQFPCELSIPASTTEEREKRISDKIVQMKRERARAIQNINIIYERLFPEGRFTHPQERVCSKYFPYTFAWYMGAFQISDDRLLEEMVEIGLQHNIVVVTDAFRKSFLSSNVFINPCSVPLGSAFPQDYMDFTKNTIQVPFSAALDKTRDPDEEVIQDFIEGVCYARKERSVLWQEASKEKLLETIGSPYEKPSIRKAVFLAEATKTAISMNLSYSEGGNILLGKDAHGPYAIIGLDSLAATRHLASFLSLEEAKKAFAIDYGIPVERLYFIEQPGDFHLDMSMAIVGEKTVLLNDAREAYSLFAKERKEYLNQKIQKIEEKRDKALEALSNQRNKNSQDKEKAYTDYDKALRRLMRGGDALRENIEHLGRFEDVVQRQLEGYGFTVLRRPGRFDYDLNVPAMNFFNMVTATTPDLERIVIAMGCVSKEYEDLFKSFLQEAGIDDVQVYFLSLKASRHCLSLMGGISCRTKTIPL